MQICLIKIKGNFPFQFYKLLNKLKPILKQEKVCTLTFSQKLALYN